MDAGSLPSVETLVSFGGLVAVLLWWIVQLRADRSKVQDHLDDEIAAHERTRVAMADMMRDYMRSPHEIDNEESGGGAS